MERSLPSDAMVLSTYAPYSSQSIHSLAVDRPPGRLQEDLKKNSKFGKISGTGRNAEAGGLGFGVGASEYFLDLCVPANEADRVIHYTQISSTAFSKFVVSGLFHHSRISMDYFTHHIPFIRSLLYSYRTTGSHLPLPWFTL